MSKAHTLLARMTTFCSIGLAAAVTSTALAQDNYPNRPIKIIVPFATGGGTSNAAHMIGEQLTAAWGQPVIIENRPGGNTIIGTEALAKSAPDGYTLQLVNSSHAINPHLMKNLPYDSDKDFAPVGTLLKNRFMVLVHPSVEANSLQEFINQVRNSQPGAWSFGTVGATGIGRLAGELFNTTAKINMVNVPYKGTGPLLQDLVGGHVKFSIEIPGVYISHVKEGRMKALAVTGEDRLPSLPDVPTFTEAGMPEFDLNSWYGIVVPAGTPQPIINKLSAEIRRIIALPEVKARLAQIEADPMPSTPEEFAALIKSESNRYAKIISDAGIRVE